MKPENIPTRLKIDHNWLVWTPKRGVFGGQRNYICRAITGDSVDGVDVANCIVAGYHKITGKPRLALRTITLYQLDRNTTPLENADEIKLFEEMFQEYREEWEKKRIVRKVKALLSLKK